jgi:GGDEF domain-containing protein
MAYFKITLLHASGDEAWMIESMLDPAVYQVEKKRMGAETAEDGQAPPDLVIVCLPQGYAPPAATAAGPFPVGAAARLIVNMGSDPGDRIRAWAMTQGGSDLLCAPFGLQELTWKVEQLIATAPANVRQTLNRPALAFIMKTLLEREIERLEPSLDPASPLGHFYPEVAQLIGVKGLDRVLLERLADEGYLKRRLYNHLRACPTCGGIQLNYRETCPRCGAVDIETSAMIHHFACGHVGPLNAFREGAALVCPKCRKVLRHIGLDYEKPTDHQVCNQCSNIFAEARVQGQCLRCAALCLPSETHPRSIYSYEPTPLLRQAIDSDTGFEVGMTALLMRHTPGTVGQQEMLELIGHELTRLKSIQLPFCLVMVRLGGLATLRQTFGEASGELLGNIFQALTRGLRTTDHLAAWDEDKIALLLPETPEAGGTIVVRRLLQNLHELHWPAAGPRPEIAAALVAPGPATPGAAEVVSQALAEVEA